MAIVYVATSKNRLKIIEVDGKTGKLVRFLQEVDPIVELPLTPIHKTPNDLESLYDGDDGIEDDIVADNPENVTVISWLLGSYMSSDAGRTEWIERHPTFDLLYVFSSFWSKTSAIVTTYRILGADKDYDGSLETRSRGRLMKLGSVQTNGLHVSHVTFSSDQFCTVRAINGAVRHKKSPSTMCVGHYMDGRLSFFDCSQDAALSDPLRVVELPEVRPETRSTTYPNPLPSIHHVTYNPCPCKMSRNDDEEEEELCKYLLVSDTSNQGRVWTYSVDSVGLPISNTPDSFRKVTWITPPSGWLTRIMTGSWVGGLAEYRIRRCVVHPNGHYVYMLLEFNTMIQVYEINPFTGRISGDCLQQISAIDPDYFGWKMTGTAIHASAELYVTDTEVFVSNRGFGFFGKSAESSVRVFSIEDDGAQLVPKQSLKCEGPVRHFLPGHHRGLYSRTPVTSKKKEFLPPPTTLFVGSDKGRRPRTSQKLNDSAVTDTCNASVEIFFRQDPETVDGIFERAGLIDVEMDDITCIAVL